MNCWLVAYDIAHPRRLQRVHRAMQNRAMPIEYSVFLFFGNARGLDECLRTVTRLLDTDADDVRVYPLPQRGLRRRLGCAVLPEGIYWTELPSA